ncbi:MULTISPECIES: hypothetical protein [Pseudomonas]|uniref:Uncharacterized protein n=1 Tax=Pseudomonas lutea TaxID=243924 RepID=A0A9X8MH51_9PSED|nr:MULTISPECIES: hypothetical protein [Pseudomonas]SER36670.1 hypothetical protein SAMN05216409_11862 [Pseudomonas lutea]
MKKARPSHLPPDDAVSLEQATQAFRKGAEPAFTEPEKEAPKAPVRQPKTKAGTERVTPVLETSMVLELDEAAEIMSRKTGTKYSRNSVIRVACREFLDRLQSSDK